MKYCDVQTIEYRLNNSFTLKIPKSYTDALKTVKRTVPEKL